MEEQQTTNSELPIIDLVPLGATEETSKAVNDLLREFGITRADSANSTGAGSSVPADEGESQISPAQIKKYATYGGVTLGSLWLISKIIK